MPSFFASLVCCLCLLLSAPASASDSSMRALYPALKADEDWLIPRELTEDVPVFDSYEAAVAGERGERELGRRAVACDADAWLALERRDGFARGYAAGEPKDEGWVRESDFISLETYLEEASNALEEGGVPRERLLYHGDLDPSVRGASVYLITLPLVMGRSDVLQIRGEDGSVLWTEDPPHPVEPDAARTAPASENAPDEETAEESSPEDVSMPDEVAESTFYTLEMVADMDGDGMGEFIWINTVEGDAEHLVLRWNGNEFVTLIEGVYFGDRTSDPDAYAFMTEDEVFHSDAGADFPRLDAWVGVSQEGLPVAEIRAQGRAVFRFSHDLLSARAVRWESRTSAESAE